MTGITRSLSCAALTLSVSFVTLTTVSAQTTTPTPVPTAPTTPGSGLTADGLPIIEVTQAVPAGGNATVGFTPPAGTQLVVSDMLVTNPNTTVACGIDVARGGTALTGGICVAAQSTLQFGFTTPITFSETTPVQLVNASAATEPVRVHLRGVLRPAPAAPISTIR